MSRANTREAPRGERLRTARSARLHSRRLTGGYQLANCEAHQTGNDQQGLRDTVSPRMVDRTPMTPDPQGGVEEVEGTFTGTHTGDLFGIPPTGRTVRFDVMDIVRIADVQIVEHWGLVDQLGLLRQLGAVPA